MRFGIVANLQKEGLPQIVQSLVQRFESEKLDFVVEKVLAKRVRSRVKLKRLKRSQLAEEGKIPSLCDMLISLGGDGTILRIARLVGGRGTPILGINLGKLGFLAEVPLEDLDSCLTEILRGDYDIVERMMLEATTHALTRNFLALNDVVIDKFGSSRVVDFETYVNEEYLATFTADGIIVSSPTGSTAYALANGGPVVAPTSRSIIISPLCPHALTVRPVVVPDDSVVRIKIASAPMKIHLTADGQDEILLKPPANVTVKKAPCTARLVKRRGVSFFDVLRKKLQWGRDVRLKGES